MDLGPTCAQLLQRHCTLGPYGGAQHRSFVLIIACLFENAHCLVLQRLDCQEREKRVLIGNTNICFDICEQLHTQMYTPQVRSILTSI